MKNREKERYLLLNETCAKNLELFLDNSTDGICGLSGFVSIVGISIQVNSVSIRTTRPTEQNTSLIFVFFSGDDYTLYIDKPVHGVLFSLG